MNFRGRSHDKLEVCRTFSGKTATVTVKYGERDFSGMDEKELQELLQIRHRPGKRRGWRCPDDLQIAGYVCGQLEESQRQGLEKHFAACDSCLDAIGFLVQSSDWPASDHVPVQLLTRARNQVRTKPPSVWGWRWAMATLAAACVVFVIAWIAWRSRSEQPVTHPNEDLVAQQHQPEFGTGQSTPSVQGSGSAPTPIQKRSAQGPPTPSVRSEATGLNPTLVFPRDGAVVKRNELNFSWKPIIGVSSYEVTVVTEAGALVFSETTSQPQLRPSDKQLPAGKYFLRVAARMPDGSTTKSRMVSFRIAPD